MMDDVRTAKELANALDDIPEQFRNVAFHILLKHRLELVAPAQVTSTRTERGAGDATFSEFYRLLEPEPNSNPQRFAAVAHYFREYQNHTSVTQQEIIDRMHEAGLPPPGNFSRDIRKTSGRRNALLMQARDNKEGVPAWQLTKTGEDFVRERVRQR